MAPGAPKPTPNSSIWAQMNYTPPRGPCNHKDSLLSPKCPCLRFMLHPLKIASSFECDGCAHHASFHSMASPADDAVLARWAASESTTTTDNNNNNNNNNNTATAPTHNTLPASTAQAPKRKRRRAIEGAPATAVTATAEDTPHAIDLLSSPPTLASASASTSDIPAAALASRHLNSPSRNWGDRFRALGFAREVEPVKTPPKGRGTKKRSRSVRSEGGDEDYEVD